MEPHLFAFSSRIGLKSELVRNPWPDEAERARLKLDGFPVQQIPATARELEKRLADGMPFRACREGSRVVRSIPVRDPFPLSAYPFSGLVHFCTSDIDFAVSVY